MSAITQIGRLSEPSQIQQFFSSVGSIFSTLCETTDSAFRRVHVMKKDDLGNIKFYNSQDKATNTWKKVAILSYVEDIKTGEMQLDEPVEAIITKCALLTLGIPIYTIGKVVWHLVKTPLEITTLALNTLMKVAKQFSLGRFSQGRDEMRYGFSQFAEMLRHGLWEIVKAPIFGLGAELAAIYGVFRPYQGRKIEALIENAWQQGASYKEDFRNITPRPEEGCLEACVKDIVDSHPFYLAHCFQIRGNTNDPRIVIIRRESL